MSVQAQYDRKSLKMEMR